jgi:hypothetical protein
MKGFRKAWSNCIWTAERKTWVEIVLELELEKESNHQMLYNAIRESFQKGVGQEREDLEDRARDSLG